MQRFKSSLLLFIVVVCLTSCTQNPDTSTTEKPRIWVLTDMSDPNDRRAGGHPYNDPDDIVSLAALLLEANRFEIERIVFSSNQRLGLSDATPFVENVFVAAYQHDLPFLEEHFPGYPESIPFERSSIQNNGTPIPFNPNEDYHDLSAYPTVSAMVAAAEEGPLNVLVWGPVTEAAMAVQHCLTTDNEKALRNLRIIAHWTKSLIAQGTPETPFKVANCNDDAPACHFLHEVALTNPDIKYIELGSIGQKGIVSGSSNFAKFEDFSGSRLGQIFRYAKFYHGQPDQSDASTFWLLLDQFGPNLEDVKQDGSLDQAREEHLRDLFFSGSHSILEDLRTRSLAAAQSGSPFPDSFIAEQFTYVYQYLNGKYYIYAPLPASYEIRSTTGQVVLSGEVEGNQELNFSKIVKGKYEVSVSIGGIVRLSELKKW